MRFWWRVYAFAQLGPWHAAIAIFFTGCYAVAGYFLMKWYVEPWAQSVLQSRRCARGDHDTRDDDPAHPTRCRACGALSFPVACVRR